MSIGLSEKELSILDDADRYGRDHFGPHAEEWDREGVFPLDAFRRAAADGYAGRLVPPECGGKGYGFIQTALTYQGLARSSVPLALGMATHSNMAYGIYKMAASAEVLNIVREAVSGTAVLSYAFTEECAGSDPNSAKSFAVPVKGGYRVSGTKSWATLGGEADYFELTVKIGGADKREMYTFLADAGSPGISVGKSYEKTGSNLLSTVDVRFDECFIPESRIISKEGYRSAMWAIGIARIFVAAMAVGVCEEALSLTAEFLGGRVQFGRPLLDNQALQWRLADFTARVEAARWLVYRAASLVDSDGTVPLESAMAKYLCANLSVELTDMCAQLFGGKGYCTGNALERMAREARMLRLIDGTSEIQLEVIGRSIKKRYGSTTGTV